MILEHSKVVLEETLFEEGLECGDIGIVVHVYEKGAAYEVEFIELDGSTFRVVTLRKEAIRSVHAKEIAHIRPLAVA